MKRTMSSLQPGLRPAVSGPSASAGRCRPGHVAKSSLIAALVAVSAIGASAPASAATVPAGPAIRIVLERAGGFIGGHDTFVVDRSTAGGHQALRLAGSHRFLRLRGSYQPANPCCDRYSYVVTVSYLRGSRKTVSTVQGTDAPRILWDVIAETERAGAGRGGSAAGVNAVLPGRQGQPDAGAGLRAHAE